MLEYLDKLRKKPRHVRERIALFTTAILSLFIVSIWWEVRSADRMYANAKGSEDISPVAAVLNIADRAKESTSSMLNELVETVKNASSTTDVAQVGNAFENNGDTIVSPQDMIDNTIRAGEEATGTASTSVE